jgi:exopolyphosphatase/guanosine-5'-triphosphate,3'-diphosphate pyrophosphatase
MKEDRIAIIDCGTNTFHLLIADISGGYPVFLHQERRAVRIGKGGISKGNITDEAAQRALNTLGEFAVLAKNNHADKILAFATSAFRSAGNGKELAGRIYDETGIDLQIIDGAEEAELIYTGVRNALKDIEDAMLVLDIGGGSVEFIIGAGNEILWKKSYEIGAQRLIDMFYQEDPIRGESVRAIHTYLDEKLQDLAAAINTFNPKILAGSSGSFETLSEMYMEAEGIDPISESELPLTAEAFQSLLVKLTSLPREERMKIPGMIEMRVDMIVVASVLIDHLITMMQPLQLRISTYALKEGVLYRWLKQQKTY